MTVTDSFIHHLLTTALDADDRGAVVAVGNFDGVHRGHQAVLERAGAIATDLGTKCMALSFEPHPRTLFRPQSPVFRLTPEPMKARVLRAFGLQGLLTLSFDKALAQTPADDFVDDVLLARIGVAHVVTGFNFHFGKDRKGSPEFLQKAGAERGFGVTIVDAFDDENKDPVSSSRIRRCLGAGEVDDAAGLLGYRWCVAGEVIKGQQLGRTLGFPTANISLPESCHLSHGIYAVRLRRANGTLYDGVASYGRRPTFDNGPALLETYAFDFPQEGEDSDLYGEIVEISLFNRLRGEKKFEDADALVTQMQRDESEARTCLAQIKPLSALDQELTF